MISNKQIYEIADKLGMVECNELNCCSADEPIDTRSDAEIFEQETAVDLVATMNFVEDLCVGNDIHTIEKFLVAIILENSKKVSE